VPVGGTAGQVLSKVDGVDYNTEWINPTAPDFISSVSSPLAVTSGNLTVDLSAYAPLASPVFTGDARAVTPATSDDDTSIATTAFVKAQGYLTSAPVTSVAGRTGAITLAVADVSGAAPLASPVFTGDARAVTPSLSDNDTSIATTAFVKGQSYLTASALTPYAPLAGATFTGDVTCQTKLVMPQDSNAPGSVTQGQIWHDGTSNFYVGTYTDTQQRIILQNTLDSTLAGYATLISPTFTGNPTAPTATFGDNDTSIATTAFVQAGLLGGTANARNLEVQVRNQSGSTIPAGSIVYISGATGNLPLITLAQANNDANSAQTIGFVKTAITNNGTGYVIVRGVLEAIDTSALTEGVQLYLSPTTAGTWTTTKPSAPQHMVYVGVVIRSHPTQGTILVAVMNGLELEELHNVSAATPSDNDLLVYELSTDLWKNKSAATLGLAGLNSPTFTGTPSLPTGTIGVTQTAGNNTTALATTAFVTASNPDASTTVKGHVELATNAEVVAGTSTTLAVTPNGVESAIVSPTVLRYFAPAWSGATSGTGAGALSVFGQQRVVAPSSAVGFAVRSHVISQNSRGVNPDNGAVNFSKRIVWGFRVSRYAFGTTSVDSVCRVVLGKTGGAGAPTVKSIGVYFDGTSVLKLMVHDGTTLRYVDTTFTPVQLQGFDAVIISEGNGNVSLFVNGSLAATSANGPVGTGAGIPVHNIEAENIAVLTGSPMGAYYANHTISIEA
jgi:hypothetical protein